MRRLRFQFQQPIVQRCKPSFGLHPVCHQQQQKSQHARMRHSSCARDPTSDRRPYHSVNRPWSELGTSRFSVKQKFVGTILQSGAVAAVRINLFVGRWRVSAAEPEPFLCSAWRSPPAHSRWFRRRLLQRDQQLANKLKVSPFATTWPDKDTSSLW